MLQDLRWLWRFPDEEGDEAADVFFALRRLFGAGRRPLVARVLLVVPGALALWVGAARIERRYGRRPWAGVRDTTWLIRAAWEGGPWG